MESGNSQGVSPSGNGRRARRFLAVTEARFAFTEDALFVAVVCRDREPGGIGRHRDLRQRPRRDAPAAGRSCRGANC